MFVCLQTGDFGSAVTVTPLPSSGVQATFSLTCSFFFFIRSLSFSAGDLDGRQRWGQGRPSAACALVLWRSGFETSKVGQSRRATAIWCSCIYSTRHTKGDTRAPFIRCQQGEAERKRSQWRLSELQHCFIRSLLCNWDVA